ncbi:MAG TPA: nuclear transport factor 2 family protein [Gemmatimonadales bacterium]|nr:nuclear transport factor 2 family protein [Gemmatimonadales bacterium]
MPDRRTLLALCLLAAPLPACRLETRPPRESSRELEAVRAVVTRFHDALAAGNLDAARSLCWPGATVLTWPREGTDWLRDAEAAIPWLYQRANVQALGSEVRIEGDLATVWLDLRLDPGTPAERDGTELLTLHRVAGVWRITHLSPAERPGVS